MGGEVWAVCGRGEVYTGVWWGNLREKDHLEDPGVNGRIIIDGSSESVKGAHGRD